MSVPKGVYPFQFQLLGRKFKYGISCSHRYKDCETSIFKVCEKFKKDEVDIQNEKNQLKI